MADKTIPWGSGASQAQVKRAVEAVTNYRTLRPQQSQTFTNLDEGTVLWARSVFQDTPIEVVVGS